MVTGDNVAIVREISRELRLGPRIVVAPELFDDGSDRIEEADGFAQVSPEHQFKIVQTRQARGHIVGMTGAGVNDAPALRQADVGIAVSGATDAARATADLELTAPGLSVITTGIEEARRIFERMNSYAIYRTVETIRVLLFMTLSIIVLNFYPVTAIMIVLLAILNDLPITALRTTTLRSRSNPCVGTCTVFSRLAAFSDSLVSSRRLDCSGLESDICI